MTNYVKANLEDLNGVMSFTKQGGNIIQAIFVLNGKEYMIKAKTFSDYIEVFVKEYPKQYRVIATIHTEFPPLKEEKVFRSKEEAENFKKEFEDKLNDMEYVESYEVDIIEEDMVEEVGQ